MSTIGISALTLLLLLCSVQVAEMSHERKDLHLHLIPGYDKILVRCDALNHNLNINKYRIKWSNSHRRLGDIYNSNVRNGNITNVIFDLKPCTDYRVEIIPLNEKREIVTDAVFDEVETLPERPPDLAKIGFGATRSDSVIVKWQLADPRCHDTSFRLIYSGRKLWGEGDIHRESFSFEDEMMENKLQIQNLQPYSSYELCVTAKNSAGTGTTSCTFVETSEGKSSPPVGLSAVWVGSTSVTLTWQEPQHVRGVVRHYTVTWATKSAMGNKKSLNFGLIRQEKTTEQTFTIESLDDAEDYTVEVTASTGAGEGEAARIDVSTGTGEGEAARIDVSTGTGEGEPARIDVSTGARQGEAARIDVSTGARQGETARIEIETEPKEILNPNLLRINYEEMVQDILANDAFHLASYLTPVHTFVPLALMMIAIII